MNSGIVEAWTGVILLYPISETASKIQSASGGVIASHSREGASVVAGALTVGRSGAISENTIVNRNVWQPNKKDWIVLLQGLIGNRHVTQPCKILGNHSDA